MKHLSFCFSFLREVEKSDNSDILIVIYYIVRDEDRKILCKGEVI